MTTAPNFSDEALLALLDSMFDFACEQPIRSYVDPARVLPALDDALAPERTRHWIERVVVPQRARLIALAKKSEVTLGAWLPDAAREGLIALAGRPVRLPKKAVEEAVATERVRNEVRSMLLDTVQNIVTKVSSGDAGGGKSGLGSALGWGARAAGGMAKGLLGGLGEEMQKQLQQKAKEYVDQSMAAVQKRIADKLTSDDTAKALGERRGAFAKKLFTRTEREAAEFVEKSKPEFFDPFVPDVVAHNLGRKELRDALESEVRALFDEFAGDSLGKVLDEAGLRAHAREAVRTMGLPLARAYVQTEGFAGWWSKAHES